MMKCSEITEHSDGTFTFSTFGNGWPAEVQVGDKDFATDAVCQGLTYEALPSGETRWRADWLGGVETFEVLGQAHGSRTSATEAKRANETAMKPIMEPWMDKLEEALLPSRTIDWGSTSTNGEEIQLYDWSDYKDDINLNEIAESVANKTNAYDKRLEGYNRKPSVERDDKHIVARIWGWLGILTTLAGVVGWAVKVYGWVQ